jgi:hypothetical protein
MQPSESPAPFSPTAPTMSTGSLAVDFAAIEDACEKWAHIISSIAEEAATLRQLSSLLQHLEEGDEGALQTLADLDFVVTNLEQELDEAEEEVKASKRAVLELESISEGADRHLESLRLVQDAFGVEGRENLDLLSSERVAGTNVHGDVLPGANVPQTLLQDESMQQEGHTSASGTSLLNDDHRGATSAPDPRPLPEGEAPALGSFRDGRSIGRRFSMAHVTEDDLKHIPRTTRGHISLSAINDALDQVHSFARRKFARIDRERRTKSQIFKYDSGRKHKPREGDLLGRGTGDDDDENDGSSALVLTEQELRQACAFFRSGEATARSLLLILCAVHRLKQARGGKNGLVYYHIPQQHQQQPSSQPQQQQSSSQAEPEKNQLPDPAASSQPSNHLLQRIHRHRQQQQQHVTI